MEGIEMLIRTTFLLGLLLAGQAAAAEPTSYEVCTYDGPCALYVQDTDSGRGIFLTTEKDQALALIWGGEWYQIPDDEYAEIREVIPARWMTRAVNPTTGVTIMEAKKTGTVAPSGGPLVTGSVTVGNITIGGATGGNCSDCHKGSYYDIHKKKIETGGK